MVIVFIHYVNVIIGSVKQNINILFQHAGTAGNPGARGRKGNPGIDGRPGLPGIVNMSTILYL